MKILILENDTEDLQIITNCINNYFKSNGMEYSVDICQNEEALLSIINQYDILFLDIELDNVNGIELGKIIKKNEVDCEIIMYMLI